MTHPETHTLLAYADHELTDAEERELARHLAGCAQCRSALSDLNEAGALFSNALHARDAAEPTHWHGALVTVPRHEPAKREPAKREPAKREPVTSELEKRESAKVLPLVRGMGAATRDPAGIQTPRRASRGHGYIRWAAVIVLVTASAASALVLRTALTRNPEPAIPDSAPAQPAPAPAPEEAAVILQPRDGVLRVVLSNFAAGSRVRVTSENRSDVRVAVSGAGAPHFTAEAGRVAIDARGRVAQVNLVLPRVLRDATVTLGSETLVTVRDGQVLPARAATTGVSVDAATTSRME